MHYCAASLSLLHSELYNDIWIIKWLVFTVWCAFVFIECFSLSDGTLQYSKACFVFDDDSNNSDGASSPPQIDDHNLSDVSSPSSSIASAPETSPILQTHFQLPPITTQSFTIGTSNSSSHANSASKSSSSSSNGNSSKSRNKKPKPKPQNKSKMIKFHEYKGPASVVKTQPPLLANTNSETPYHIMLEQQQLFLQWQLEFQQQNMPVLNLSPEGAQQLSSSLSGVMMAPAPPSCSAGTTMTTSTPSVLQALSPAQPSSPSQQPQQQLQPRAHSQPPVLQPSQTLVPAQPAPATTTTSTHTALPKVISNLEDMKVADLKAELKKRNLHVSGSKPQLIERLKPYIDSIISPPVPVDTATSTSPSGSVVNSISEMSVASPPSIPTLPSFLNMKPVFSPEESMNTNLSPPLSPNHVENCGTPMSPDEDTSLPSTLGMSNGPQLVKSHFSHSQSSIPMAIDQISRPPSVMSAETAPMEVEQPPVFSSCMPIDLSKTLSSALQSFQLASFNSSQQQVKLQLPIQQSHIQQPQQMNVVQQQSLQPQAVQQALTLLQPVTAQQSLKPQQLVGSPQAPQQQQYTQAELLQQQQKKIDELQQQLIQLQQFQAHQQKQLTQRQPGPQSPPQFVLGFPAETGTGKGTKLQHAVTNSNVMKPMVMGATHLLPSLQAMPTVIVTNNTPAKEATLPQANFTPQPLKLKHKPNLTFAKSPPDGQPFIFTSKHETKADCSVNRRLTPSPCNGINRWGCEMVWIFYTCNYRTSSSLFLKNKIPLIVSPIGIFHINDKERQSNV